MSPNPNVFKNMDIRCDICGMMRPHTRISVRKIDVAPEFDLTEGCATENVRYCNDMVMCEELAMKKKSVFEKPETSTSAAATPAPLKKFTDKLNKTKANLEKAQAEALDSKKNIREYLAGEPARRKFHNRLALASCLLWIVMVVVTGLSVGSNLSNGLPISTLNSAFICAAVVNTAMLAVLFYLRRVGNKHLARLREIVNE